MRGLLKAAVIGGFSLVLASSAAFTRPPIQLRGTIQQVDGSMVSIKTRYGAPVKFTIGENPEIVAAVKSTVADIKPGDVIGSNGRADANGDQRAQVLYIFPEAMRKSWESSSGWAATAKPNRSVVDSIQPNPAEANGYILTVKSENGGKKLIVSPTTAVLTFADGDKNDLKQGVEIFVADAEKRPEGMVETKLVVYGRDGVAPPL